MHFFKFLTMYSYRYVRSVLYFLFSSCQLAPFGYTDWFFSVLFLSCKVNASVKLAKTGHCPHPSKLLVLLYELFMCKCALYYCHQLSTQLQLTNISTYQHTTINSNQTPPVFLSTLSFNSCTKTAPIRRSMKWISTRKQKSIRRKTCPEIFL
jgi:hypothetical protein